MSNKTPFKAAAAIFGAGSLGWCLLVGPVPCYPVCHLLCALVNHGVRATVNPPFLRRWGPPVADAWGFLLNVASI